MKRILTTLVALLLTACASLAAAAVTVTASATATWTAVTQSTSGATLTGVTYTLYAGNVAAGGTCSTSGLTQLATGLTSLNDTVSLPGLTPGTLECFAVTATAAGVTGAYSNLASISVPSPPTPGATTVTVIITFVSAP